MSKELKWNVICEVNHKIKEVNVLNACWPFSIDLIKIKKECKDNFEEFSKAVESSLLYYYWGRCEWEVVICEWPAKTFKNEKEIQEYAKEIEEKKKRNEWPVIDIGYPEPALKIDVYSQVMMNFNIFINYLWTNKRHITKKGLGLE